MEFPKKCPYCGKDIVEHCVASTSKEDSYFTEEGQRRHVCEIHKCIHCNAHFYAIKEVWHTGDIIRSTKVIQYYPAVTTIDFPKRIKELSPTAYNTYEQTIKAKEQGFDMLVGAGLRIALE